MPLWGLCVVKTECYLLAWDPWGSGWADLSGKTGGSLGNKRKTLWKNFPTKKEWPVARGGYVEAGLWGSIVFKRLLSGWNVFQQREEHEDSTVQVDKH